jgi:SAM-dependent methyltransferase
MDRIEALLSYIDVDHGCGLEIGPLDKAVVKRVPGRQIYYCDYAGAEILRAKSSADPNVNIDLIPEIDFIAPCIKIETFHGIAFDYIIASHVIEHVPDLIGWLNTLTSVLRNGGRIVLAVPDRRYTFDYIRPISTVGELVQAHVERRTKPSFSQVYEGFSRAVKADTIVCWEGSPYNGELEPYYSKDFALRLARDTVDNGAYHDCHCWVFEYESFLKVISELQEIGVLKARIMHHAEPVYGANEFHVVIGAA